MATAEPLGIEEAIEPGQVWRSKGELFASFLTVEARRAGGRWRCRENAHSPDGDFAGRSLTTAVEILAGYTPIVREEGGERG